MDLCSLAQLELEQEFKKKMEEECQMVHGIPLFLNSSAKPIDMGYHIITFYPYIVHLKTTCMLI